MRGPVGLRRGPERVASSGDSAEAVWTIGWEEWASVFSFLLVRSSTFAIHDLRRFTR